MTDTQPETETSVMIVVDGHEVAARPGELLIDACQRAGTYIPRFCYHERMKPVGMCRMCLVEVDTCLLYTSPSPRDATLSRMPSSA